MTLLASAPGSATSRDAAGSEPRTRPRWLLRRIPGVALAGLLLIITGTAFAIPGLVLLGLVTTTTAGLRRWLPLDVAVPVAALGLVGASVAFGLAAEAAGVDLLARPWLLSSVYVGAASAVVIAAATRSPGLAEAIGKPASPPWWTFLPALVATATGLVQVFSLDAAKSWAFQGTDLVRHMTTISILQRDGALDYATTSYPRGLHMLAALVSVPRAPVDNPTRLLAYDLQLTTGLTWFSLGLLIWTGVALTARMGRVLPLHPQVPALGALILGIGALATNTFLFGFVYMGAAPSLVAVAAVWALPLLLVAGVVRSENLIGCAVCACATAMLLSHLWQPLVLAPAGGLALLLGPNARELRSLLHSQVGRLAILRQLPAAALLLWLAAVPMLAVQQAGGIGLAAIPGHFPGDPWRLLTPAAVAALPLMREMRQPWVRILVGSTIGLGAVWLVMLRGAGFALDAWYPLKAAWFLTIMLAPMLALAGVRVVLTAGRATARLLAHTGRPAFVLKATAVASALACAGAFGLPPMMKSSSLLLASWRVIASGHSEQPTQHLTSSAERFDIAAKYSRMLDPAVVVPYYVGTSAVFDVDGTRLVSEILSFKTGQPELRGEPRDLCQAIRTLAGGRPAVVISKLSQGRVRRDMTAHGCPGRAPVVHVPGQLGEVSFAKQLSRANSHWGWVEHSRD